MPSGRVFISYRREDTSATAGRLYDRLVAQFGSGNVFMDVDSITPGYDFANVIESAVASCQVVLAVIGKSWLDASDERGRRLDDPDDFVVLEIKAGLDREIPVIRRRRRGSPGHQGKTCTQERLRSHQAPLEPPASPRQTPKSRLGSTKITTRAVGDDIALVRGTTPRPPATRRFPPIELSLSAKII